MIKLFRKIEIKEKKFEISLLFTSFIIRLIYANTRNIFDSGPDANTFKQMALDLASLPYFNSEVNGFPIYSPGYPMFLAINIILFGDYWIVTSQILQITMSCSTAIIIYSCFKKDVNPKLGKALLFLLLFHPAIVVLSVSCMYESLLIFCLVLILKMTFIDSKSNFSIKFGLTSIFAIAIHPRIIPIILLALIIGYHKKSSRLNPRDLGLIISLNLITIIIVVFRNYKYSNYLGLAAGTEYGIKFGHPVLIKCASTGECLWWGITNNPSEFLREAIINVLHFYSPWSGPLEKGTWFHNISLYKYINQFFGYYLTEIITIIVTVIGILLFLIGMAVKISQEKKVSLFVSLSLIVLVMTDAFVYGDSRHRLLIAPILYAFQFVAVGRILSIDVKNENRQRTGYL